MGVTNPQSGTRVDEVAQGVYRIHTPFPDIPGGFSFNQYLIVDDQPLLFHTGSRTLSRFVSDAIASVIPVSKLRFIGFSHFETDECGGLNELLAQAPHAVPVCGKINAMINSTAFDRAPKVLSDKETLSLGKRQVRWFDAAHLPHAWECGYLMDEGSQTLLCGDLFTQGGSQVPPVVTSDVLGTSESFRKKMDYYSHTNQARPLLSKLAAAQPTTLACMHGSAWQGDGAKLLFALADALAEPKSHSG